MYWGLNSMDSRANASVKRSASAPKWIAIGVALFVGWKVVDSVAIQPIRQRSQQLKTLKHQQQQNRDLAGKAQIAAQYIRRKSVACVSANPAVVAHRYRQWLIERSAGSSDINITPSTPIPEGDIGWKVMIQVEGSAEIDWIASTIDALDHAPLMHRIAYLSINTSVAGNADFVLTLEALAIHGADEIETWPDSAEKPTITLARFLRDTEPFKRGYAGPKPKLVAKVPQAPKRTSQDAATNPRVVDRLATLRVVGSVSIDSRKQAWLVDSSTGQEILVAEAGQFQIDKCVCRVSKIAGDYIEISVTADETQQAHESTFQWPLGTSLRDAMH